MPVPDPRGFLRFAVLLLISCCSSVGFASNLDRANASARDFVRQTMQERRIPGLQVAVIKDGRIVLSESLGMANVENRVASTGNTLFPLNSATKAFTGVAIMQLVEAGRVDLEAPLSRYLDALPDAWQGIRVRQLLAHTSGLPDIVGEQGLVGGGSEDTAWQTVQQMPLQAAPGERFAYNQTNYALLARIIEARAGMPYARYVQSRQFDATGMQRATFGDSYDLLAGAATVYSYFPRVTDRPGTPERLSHWFYDMPPDLWAGGGMQTAADDVARWLVALLQGRLISKASLERMWTAERLNDGSVGDWAGGWPVSDDAGHRQVASMGGARAAFLVYPDEGLAVVVLTNLVGANPQQFIPRIADFYR